MSSVTRSPTLPGQIADGNRGQSTEADARGGVHRHAHARAGEARWRSLRARVITLRRVRVQAVIKKIFKEADFEPIVDELNPDGAFSRTEFVEVTP